VVAGVNGMVVIFGDLGPFSVFLVHFRRF
jgi:hypothetical protein